MTIKNLNNAQDNITQERIIQKKYFSDILQELVDNCSIYIQGQSEWQLEYPDEVTNLSSSVSAKALEEACKVPDGLSAPSDYAYFVTLDNILKSLKVSLTETPNEILVIQRKIFYITLCFNKAISQWFPRLPVFLLEPILVDNQLTPEKLQYAKLFFQLLKNWLKLRAFNVGDFEQVLLGEKTSVLCSKYNLSFATADDEMIAQHCIKDIKVLAGLKEISEQGDKLLKSQGGDWSQEQVGSLQTIMTYFQSEFDKIQPAHPNELEALSSSMATFKVG